jgi:heptosyltransferase-2
MWVVENAERRNPLKYRKKLKLLAAQGFDIIIDAQSTGRSELVSWFCRKTSQYRIGRYKKGRGHSYTSVVKDNDDLDKLQQRLALLEPLFKLEYLAQQDASPNWLNARAGLSYDKIAEALNGAKMALTVPQEIKQTMRSKMQQHGIDFAKPVYVFSVSSKESHKKWSMQEVLKVARHCIEHHHAQIVCYYVGDEEKDVRQFHRQLGHSDKVFTDIPTPSLLLLSALMSNCDMFVGNEGGPRHISQALDVPSVAVFSPSADKHTWLPSASKRFQGFSWRDFLDSGARSGSRQNTKPYTGKEDPVFENGDSQYYRLYNSIVAERIIEAVDEIAELYLSKVVLSKEPAQAKEIRNLETAPNQDMLKLVRM